MISLLTGTPGSGKTCWLVNHLMQDPTVSQRPLYVHGIPHLKLPHEPIYCTSPVCEPCGKIPEEKKAVMLCAEEWPEWAPEGALLVLDEVQNVWRPRASSAKLPDSVAKLETHRHRGLDFWMISQGPHLFDSNVRRLIGRHIHLRSTSLGRYEFEWPECKDNVQSTSDAVRRLYRLPKKAFDMYQSASLHTKQEHRKPLALYVAGAAALFVCYVAVSTFLRLSGDDTAPSDTAVSAPPGGVDPHAGAASAVTAGGSPPVGSDHANDKGALVAARFQPVLRGRPETAEAYMQLLTVRDYPFPAACVRDHVADTCQCSTNQGTPYDMPKEICFEYAAGRVFNPYKARRRSPVYTAEGKVQNQQQSVDPGPQSVPLLPEENQPTPPAPVMASTSQSVPASWVE